MIAEFNKLWFFDKKGGIKAAARSPLELNSRKLRREILLPIHSPKIDN
jgi:hypothetical protein